MKSRKKQILFSIAGIFFGFSLSLVFAEFALRIFTPDWLILRMKVANVGEDYYIGSYNLIPEIRVNGKFRNFVPNSKFVLRHYEWENQANIDELGGRVTKYAKTDKIVPFLGDSFTFGIGVEDDETYVSNLAIKATGRRFLNLGVAGSALNNHIDIIEMRHDELGRPKLYILNVFLGNDLTGVSDYYKSKGQKQTPKDNNNKKIKEGYSLQALKTLANYNKFLKKLYVFQFVRHELVLVVIKGLPRLRNPIFLITQKNKSHLTEAIEYYEKELVRLNELADKLDFKFIFILLPDVYQINKSLLEYRANYFGIEREILDMQSPNRLLGKALNKQGIDFIDLTKCLMRDNALDNLYYKFDKHFTKYGHKAAAKCVLEDKYFFNALTIPLN